jgi:hypothetical protein
MRSVDGLAMETDLCAAFCASGLEVLRVVIKWQCRRSAGVSVMEVVPTASEPRFFSRYWKDYRLLFRTLRWIPNF